MALLKDSAHILPLVRNEDISKIEREALLYSSPCATQVLKLDIRAFPLANLAAKSIKRGHNVFQGISDEMVREFSIHRIGESKFFSCQFQVLRQNLNRIVNPAVGTPSEHAVDGIAERTAVADDFGFELFFTVILDGMRGPRLHRQADADSKGAGLGTMVELQ